jgi:tetratricopeptide (TPR) repeat protein
LSTHLARRALGGFVCAALLALQPPLPALAEQGADGGAAEGKQGEEPRIEKVKKSRKQLREERRKYVVKPKTARIFEQAREHLGASRPDEAKAALDELQPGKLTPYERAQAQRLYGYTAYDEGRNAAAIEHLQKALAEDVLPAEDRADVLFQVAQIQAVERRWKDAIAALEAWFQSVERPNSVGYYLMALAHFQLEDLDAALLPAKKAVEIAKKPQQAWLQLLLAIHLSRKDYAAATPVAVELVELYPNVGKAYWLQLSALHGVMGDGERSLGVLELAYRKGILTEDRDLRRLVQLTLLRGLPYRAAQILQKELAEEALAEDAEAMELLGMSWILAREVPRAEAPLTRAAELATKGNVYLRLAQLHLMQERWEAAADALRNALAKGGLDDPASAQLLLGVACYNERKLEEARAWFARAHQSGGVRKQAETWIEQVDRELGTIPSAARAGDREET